MSRQRQRVVVVAKRTDYSRFVAEQQDPHAVGLIKGRHASVAHWKKEEREHVRTLAVIERTLKRLGVRAWVLHGPRVVFDTSDAELVITVGGDGTLLAASHQVKDIPILGINSSPAYSVGFFCAGHRGDAEELIDGALAGNLRKVSLTRMEVVVAGRVISRRVLNDGLFCHPSPAAASRYIVNCGGRREEQLSSGFWVSTAAGSTGAIRSAGGQLLPLPSKRLQVVVREPFCGTGKRFRMTRFVVEPKQSVRAVCTMPEGAVFLDGPFDRTMLRLGDTVEFRASDEPITVLGLESDRARDGRKPVRGSGI